jgi:hypothetical protein
LLSFDDTIDDLTAICQRNGGQILWFYIMVPTVKLKK